MPLARRILEDISDPESQNAFITRVASLIEDGFSPVEIEEFYDACPISDIPGYHPRTPDHQLETVSMADPPNSSQRSGDSCHAGPARQSGANEGRRRASNDGDYYARQRAFKCIYAPRPGLQGSGSERSSLPWSGKFHPISYLPQISTHVLTVADPSSSRGNQCPHDRMSDSDYGDSGSHHGSWYGYPRNDNTPSGNRFGGDYTRDGEYSSRSNWSGSTIVPSDSISQQGRAGRGSEQARRDSGRAYR